MCKILCACPGEGDTSLLTLWDAGVVALFWETGTAKDRCGLRKIGDGDNAGSEQRGSPSGCVAICKDVEKGDLGRPVTGAAGADLGEVLWRGTGSFPGGLGLSLSPNRRDQEEFERCLVLFGNAEGEEADLWGGVDTAEVGCAVVPPALSALCLVCGELDIGRMGELP